MKRFVILLMAMILCISGFAFAEESVLIDFSAVAADFNPDSPQPYDPPTEEEEQAQGYRPAEVPVPETPPEEGQEPTENSRTLIDFSDKAGTGFTAADRRYMITSLAPDNWDVVLASSSRTVFNQSHSMTKQVKTRDADDVDDAYRNKYIMGVRVHFPTGDYNSWAMVSPPFEVPIYMKKTRIITASEGDYEVDPDIGYRIVPVEGDPNRTKFNQYGVVKNVGVIKSISMRVLGMNFPMGCEIVVKDHNNEEQSMFMGYLYFDGWRELTWENPNYIEEVRNRELRRFPLYPRATPSVKLMGIRFLRDKEQLGGDFITYIKDITVTYDRAVLDLDTDVENERVWGILTEREEGRRTAEFERLGEMQVLRELERKKMHKIEENLDYETEGDGGGGGTP